MSELLPCPFCGGEAELVEGEYGMYLTGYAIYCKGTCGAKLGVTGRLCEAYEWTPYYDTEAEAIAAWNSRAERVTDDGWESYQHSVPATEENMAKFGWVRERTCRNLDKHHNIMFKCSECGHWECQDFDGEKILPQTWNYCPNCGARRVDA